MKSRLLVGLLASAAIASIAPAKAAGSFSTLPVVGGNSFCASYIGSPTGQAGVTGTGGGTGAGSVCGQTVPAGPVGPTGLETIPLDTNQANGAPPQTAVIPLSMLGFGSNKLIGGDFNTNLAQRLSTVKGVTSLATLSPTAAVMTADGWWTYAAAAGVTVTIASGTTEVLPALGTTKAIRLARTTSGAAGTMCLGQTLDQFTQSAPLIGNNAVFSFWELNGSAMSATNGAFTANISYSSGAAAAATQATLGFAGSEGSKYAIGTQAATFGTGGPTNQTAAVPVLSPGVTGSVGANGFVTIPGSTAWTRYSFAAPIPATIPGTTTAVTDVSVEVCFNPTLTSAITTDWIELQGLQLEAKPSTATANLPNGVISPSGFERRPAALEAVIDYSYWYYNFEAQVAGGIETVANCLDVTTTKANCFIQFPTTMRIVPAVDFTDGFEVNTTTGYSAVNACSGLALSTSYATVASQQGFWMNCTASTTPAAGTANVLTTLGTSSSTGIISASALP